jgi:hypothetical protein
MQTTLIHADATTKDTTASTPDSSTNAATDPSVPSSDGSCHLMRLPTELRLAIAEDVFEDFFNRLTLGLYPLCFEKGEGHLLYTQELFSVLHVNHAFRLETINLCTKLAKNSAEEVVSHPPSTDFSVQWPRRSIRIGAHEQLKSKHKKILKALQQAKVGAGDAESGVGVPGDLFKALNTRGSGKPRSQGRRGRVRWRIMN